jgi:hypothetical protein
MFFLLFILFYFIYTLIVYYRLLKFKIIQGYLIAELSSLKEKSEKNLNTSYLLTTADENKVLQMRSLLSAYLKQVNSSSYLKKKDEINFCLSLIKFGTCSL